MVGGTLERSIRPLLCRSYQKVISARERRAPGGSIHTPRMTACVDQKKLRYFHGVARSDTIPKSDGMPRGHSWVRGIKERWRIDFRRIAGRSGFQPSTPWIYGSRKGIPGLFVLRLVGYGDRGHEGVPDGAKGVIRERGSSGVPPEFPRVTGGASSPLNLVARDNSDHSGPIGATINWSMERGSSTRLDVVPRRFYSISRSFYLSALQ